MTEDNQPKKEPDVFGIWKPLEDGPWDRAKLDYLNLKNASCVPRRTIMTGPIKFTLGDIFKEGGGEDHLQ